MIGVERNSFLLFLTDVPAVMKPSRIPIPIFYTHPELWRSWSETCLYGNASGASSSSEAASVEFDVEDGGASSSLTSSDDEEGRRRRSIVASS